MEATKKKQPSKKQRDEQILFLLTQFKVMSREHLTTLVFSKNSNPTNVCNRVMKRLVQDGIVLAIPRTKDKSYCYTLKKSPISIKSQAFDHHLAIVDVYIQLNAPKRFAVEPLFGSYSPDLFYIEKDVPVCVEVQITNISEKRIQKKVDDFVKENGTKHNAKIMYLFGRKTYTKINTPNGYKIIQKRIAHF